VRVSGVPEPRSQRIDHELGHLLAAQWRLKCPVLTPTMRERALSECPHELVRAADVLVHLCVACVRIKKTDRRTHVCTNDCIREVLLRDLYDLLVKLYCSIVEKQIGVVVQPWRCETGC